MSVVSGTGSASSQAAAALRVRRRVLRRLDAGVSPYLYIAPFFVIFGVFGLFPLVYTAYVSLTDRNLLNPVSHFIGLHNYALLIHDSYFWNSVENTFGIWFLSTVPQLGLALVIAHVLNTKLRARTFFRMAVLLPQVTSIVAVALIFTQLFGHDYGFVNYVFGLFGVHHIYWESGRLSSWIALSVMVIWRWTGFNALIYLASMQSIPEELYEAAAVDGARRFRQFIHVTVPMLRPTILFTVVISTIGGLQLFTEGYLFQPRASGGTGGSARQYQTIVMYLYEKFLGSTQFKFGYAAAIAWCLVLLIALFGLVNYFLVSRIRSAEA
jgi:cellobiose transport system permease protein